MPFFVKKPMKVKAEQWFPGKAVPGVWGDEEQGLCPCYVPGGNHSRPHVMTAHGQIVHLAPGDWVMPEPNGSGHYPIKDEIMRATYDEVSEMADAVSWPGEKQVHDGADVEMFMLVYTRVPGQKPHIVCTAKFCKSPTDAELRGDGIDGALACLIARVVKEGTWEMIRGLCDWFKLPDSLRKRWGLTPEE